ncbi:MAG: CDP-diacylglycerol--glycerol-3-phosphate 3-phosphatidyltransferase [Oscillospiraceae bacterium]|nr:CDP-diacylglycerol--glycerol-3-phosphate 3-phosphatidyltransferase [Oscillospiraceae bacterium]
MNTANKLTMFRVALIPVFLAVIYTDFSLSRYVALAVFIVACLTDFADGYIARKYDQVTDFGKFMDPLADKVLVTAALAVFTQWGKMPAWALAVVVTREFAVTALRLVAADKGRVIAAAKSGKLKTAATMICICVMLLPVPRTADLLCTALILVTTVYSGVEYFIRNRDCLSFK